MRRTSVGAVLTAAAILLSGVSAGSAEAKPVYPSADEVKKARQKAAEALTDVKEIQDELDDSAARVESADLALSMAAEDYDSAKVELDEAKKAAKVATAAATEAQERLDEAQTDVGQLAAQAYRSGGPIAGLDVLFSPAGPDQVLERATMMQTVAAGQQRTVHRMDEARVTATTLQRQATHAVEVQNAAAEKMKAAQETAETKAEAAHAALEEQAALKIILVAKLATARKTSVAKEEARQQGLREEAERRREAQERARQERAERERAEQNDDSGGGGSTGGGGGSGGGGGGGESDSGGGSSAGTSTGGAAAVAWARRKVGLPYLWGGDGPGSYDCSGLTMKAWAQAGVSLPHSSRMQYSQTEHVSYGNLRKGDLIFYATDTSRPSTIHHVTMYAGDGMMIEAPYTGAFVRVVPLRRGESMPYAGRP